MIQIVLWRGDTRVEVADATDDVEAEEKIDAILTAVHQGKHGAGTYSISADRFDDNGAFQAFFYGIKSFTYPPAQVPA